MGQKETLEEKFTIAEFRKYIESSDSFGDVLYYLTAENVIKANQPEPEPEQEEEF